MNQYHLMQTIQRISLLAIALLAALGIKAQSLPLDSTYRVGKLANGLTYYIRHNAKEKGIADFYLAQRVGSILEEPQQRGLAHFLEHMAFNGSEHFRGTKDSPTIVDWCEKHGIGFGPNLNAYTSIDETVYHVSAAPVTQPAMVDSLLLILSDWSHGLTLTDDEIDRERGVVHEEWRTRRAGAATQRLMEATLPYIYPGSKYADCMPIGSMDIIDHFPYQALRDYYHRWYRPDLQAVIIVGDIDVDDMEQRVRRLFSQIPMPAHPAERVYYPVPDNEEMMVTRLSDPEQPLTLVSLYMKRDAATDAEKDSWQYVRDAYIDELITFIIGERLDAVQEQTPKPCLSVSVQNGTFFVSRTKDAFALSFGAREENMRRSFDAAIGCIEQVRQHGFTEAEVQRAKEFRHKVGERFFNERTSRRNSYFVKRAQQHFLEGEPLVSERFSREAYSRLEREVTLSDVNAAMRSAITDQNQVLVVYTPEKEGFTAPTTDTLKAWVLAAQARQYPVYQSEEVPTELMAVKPLPGSIVKEEAGPFGTTHFTLSNGVNVYYRQTDYAHDQVGYWLFGEGGTSVYPDSLQPNFHYIAETAHDAGVANFDELALDKILAGKIVRMAPAVDDETQSITGTGAVKDVETMFQLAYLYFTQPRYDKASFRNEQDRVRSFLANRDANPNVAYNDSIIAIVYGPQQRIRPMTLDNLEKADYPTIYKMYRDRFSNAANFNLIVIGNVSRDTIVPLLEQYVASLPATGKKEHYVDNDPPIRAADETHVWVRPQQTPLAKVNILYSWDDDYTAKNDLTIDILSRVLETAYTDSVREALGGVYGIGVDAGIDKESHPAGVLKIDFTTDPEKYEQVIPVVYRQLQLLADRGPDATVLSKVKRYLRKRHQQAVVTNDYWNMMVYHQVRYGVDFHTSYLSLLDALTPDDVRQMARRIVQSHRRLEITMKSGE